MVFCQLADCQSLRDIELGMKGIRRELGHLGIRKAPSRNALSQQNRRRNPWVAREIYMRTREKLMGQQPYDCRFRSGIKAARVLLLDSSMVTLCEKVFNWAGYSEEKGAVKPHTLFSFNDFLPVDVFVSDGKMSDNDGAYHVLRRDIKFRRTEAIEQPDDREQDILVDEVIRLTGGGTRNGNTRTPCAALSSTGCGTRTHTLSNSILSRARLPIPPSRQLVGAIKQGKTEIVKEFTIYN